MNGRNLLLILTHLFRNKGPNPTIDDAVGFLSFKCRYGTPSNIRRMLTLAIENEMISIKEGHITPEFHYDKQHLSPNQTVNFEEKVIVDESLMLLQ